MTVPNLDEIRARLEATTGEAWADDGVSQSLFAGKNYIASFAWDSDMEFCAAAKQDIPTLLTLVDEQAAEIERLRGEVAAMGEALKNERIINQMLREQIQQP